MKILLKYTRITQAIGKFDNLTKNSKHIEVQCHYVNENYEKGVIDIVKIETEKNIVNIFTKSLCKDKFIKNRNALKLIYNINVRAQYICKEAC